MQYQKIFNGFLGGNRPSDTLSELMQAPEGINRLIDSDFFISEFKLGTQRIKQYMTYSRFQDLLQLITVVGDQNDRKRAYKFPLTASELLCLDSPQIDQYFLPLKGVVAIDEKIINKVEKEVEQQIDDDDDDQQEKEAKQKAQNEETGTDQNKEKAAEGEEKAVADKQEDEQFGDFVEAPLKKKKMIKVKEVVEQIEIKSEEHPALLTKLIEYYSQPINYTLTAYVSKVMLNLLNRRPQQFLTQIFANKDQTDRILESIFGHLGSRSVVDLLTRIFTIQNNRFIQERFAAFLSMVSYLLKAESLDAISNIVACVGEVFDKLTAHFKIISPVQGLNIYSENIPQLLQKLLQMVLGQKETVSSYSVSIICQCLSFYNLSSQSSKIQGWFKKYLEGTVAKLQSYLREERVRLGVVGYKILQSYNICIKIDQLASLFSPSKDLFLILTKLIQKYPFNNIFQNEVLKLFSVVLASPLDELTQNLVRNGCLLEWLEEEAKAEEDRRETTQNVPRKGYYGHIFKLCNLLSQNKTQKNIIQKLVEDEKFIYIKSILVEPQAESELRRLGGLEKKQNIHQIKYDKQSILETYSKFLSSAPPAVLQNDLDDPAMNPILLEELQRQLDGVEIVNDSVPEDVAEEEHHKAELIEENVHHKDAFWKTHLDYDVDGLMEDLA